MDEDIIFLIDGYVHRSEYVETAIAATLVDPYRNLKTGKIAPPQPEILRRVKLYGSVIKHWRFIGDENRNASMLIEDTLISRNQPFGEAATCTISLTRDSNIDLRVGNMSLNQFPGISWDGEDLTPFCKRQRRYIKAAGSIHNVDNYGQKYDPIDVVCDTAHAAIWTWFHGGDITDELLPTSVKARDDNNDNLLADYYASTVRKLYRADNSFQRPHRSTRGR